MSILVIHICIAIFSLISTTYALFRPSKRKLYINYTATTLTVMTGTYVAVTNPVHITQTCISGLLYIGFVSTLMAGAYYRLAHVPVKNNR